jgi:hypothetical protein
VDQQDGFGVHVLFRDPVDSPSIYHERDGSLLTARFTLTQEQAQELIDQLQKHVKY